MIIYAKIGTLCGKHVHVVRKRKAPQVGDYFKVIESLDRHGRPEKYYKPSGVYCREIRTVGNELLYVLDRF